MNKNHPEKNYKARILIGLIILAVLAATLAAVLIMRNSQRKNPQETPQTADGINSASDKEGTESSVSTAVSSGSAKPGLSAGNADVAEDAANGIYQATLHGSAQEYDPTYITSVTADGEDLLVTGVLNYYQNGVGENPDPDRVTAYGTIRFHTNNGTRYMGYGGDSPGEALSRESFLDTCSALNGLGLEIDVENGEVKEASVSS
ncbi:MAG: hypothetical protein LKG53_01325 [Lachnospiraceae bacterium]|jgi:hypothetical protein|nr:hypothetical protein [Lachnospiraceae bacterium]